MKLNYITLCLCTTLCSMLVSCKTPVTQPPDVPVAVPYPADPVIPANSKYLYWYSQQQKFTLLDMQIPAFMMMVSGQQLEYTECQPEVIGHPVGRFTDYVLVAETNTGPCEVGKGEW